MSGSGPSAPIRLRRLRRAGIVLPVAAIIIFQGIQIARNPGANVAIGILSVIAVIAFGVTMFALLGRVHRHIEHQNRELAGTNAILTAVARHDPLPIILDKVRSHVVELLDADDASIDLAPGHQVDAATPAPGSVAPPSHEGGAAAVVLRGANIGTIQVHCGHELQDREQRTLDTAADMVSLAVAQAGLLEQERHLARVDELDRIARELHDSLAQVLGTLHLRLRAIPDPIGDHAVPVRTEIDALGDLCHAAYQDVREAIMGLRTLTRPEESFTQSLRTYVSQYARLGGPETELDLDDTEMDLDPAARLHMMRMIQEALTNTRKHADAQRVRISLQDGAGGHHVVVEDDGRGFDPETRRRDHVDYGLQTMHERSHLIGAALDIQSAPGHGTRVSIRVPHPTAGVA